MGQEAQSQQEAEAQVADVALVLLVLPGAVRVERPRRALLAALRARGELLQQALLFGAGGDGVQTGQIHAHHAAAVAVRAEARRAQVHVDTGAVSHHNRVQMLLRELTNHERTSKLRPDAHFWRKKTVQTIQKLLYFWT